jgi:hypothetical protein
MSPIMGHWAVTACVGAVGAYVSSHFYSHQLAGWLCYRSVAHTYYWTIKGYGLRGRTYPDRPIKWTNEVGQALGLTRCEVSCVGPTLMMSGLWPLGLRDKQTRQ